MPKMTFHNSFEKIVPNMLLFVLKHLEQIGTCTQRKVRKTSTQRNVLGFFFFLDLPLLYQYQHYIKKGHCSFITGNKMAIFVL